MGLLVVVIQDERFHYDYVLESGWGLLYLVLVTVPLVRLAVRPGAPVALAQLGLVTLVVLIGAGGGSWAQGWNGLALAVTAWLLTWLGPRQRLRWGRVDLPLSFLALLGLPAVVAYGAPLVGNTSDDEVTNGVSHYPTQASLALALVALASLAAVTSSRLPAWTAAFCGCWLGLESIVYPDVAASLGTVGGAFTVGWSVLLLAVERAAGPAEASRARLARPREIRRPAI
ncbi:hypothetical protein [Terrabacter sp. 2YAF2]|uniref:hypothetical protein n=1 Tax=Terrabacter sp. 2YAF2 TaxID=3233026 RepID=UPI003F951DC2